jgi:hypothetical protein
MRRSVVPLLEQNARRGPRLRWVLACGAVLTACGSGAGSLGEVGTYADGGSFAGDDGGGGALLRVSVSPAQSSVCSGQCADLTVTAAGGVPPYTYAWSGGLEGTPAAQRVCPTATTTYVVTATDSSGRGGELAAASARASGSATVTVTPECDGGAADGAAPAVTEAQELCSHTWAAVPGVWNASASSAVSFAAMTTDALGDIIVAIPELQGTQGITVVAKFDAECNEVWSKQYVAQLPPGFIQANVVPTSVTTDASSNIVVAGLFSGSLDFGKGALSSANFGLGSNAYDYYAGTAFLIKLDPQGNTTWSQAFAANSNASQIDQVVTDAAGNIDFAAVGPGGMDFGGGAVGGTSALNLSYVVQLGADGSYRFAKPVTASQPAMASNATGAMWVTGTAGAMAVDWGGGSVAVTNEAVVLGEFSSAGAYVSSFSWAPLQGNYSASNAVVDASGEIFVSTDYAMLSATDGGTDDSLSSRTITKLSASGAPLWSDATTFLYETSSAPQWLALDAAANVFVGGDFQGTLGWGGAVVTSAGDYDVYVRVYDTAGHPRSIARWGGSGAERLSAMTTDASGNAIVLGVQGDPGGMPTSLFIAKLAP